MDNSNWNAIDTGLAIAGTLALAADWAQTKEFTQKRDKYNAEEMNPILGKKPTAKQVDQYFATAAIANLAGMYLIKDPATRRIAESAVIGIELGTVQENKRRGVKVSIGGKLKF